MKVNKCNTGRPCCPERRYCYNSPKYIWNDDCYNIEDYYALPYSSGACDPVHKCERDRCERKCCKRDCKPPCRKKNSCCCVLAAVAAAFLILK